MTDLFIDGGNAYSTFDEPAAPVPAPVFAPDIATYSARAAYITPTEFTEAGTGVDVSQLVPAGSTQENAAALARNIAQASAIADTFCSKVLACTLDTDAGRWPVRDGVCAVPVRFTPVIEVTGISTGADPWTLTPLGDLSRVAIEPPKLVRFAADGCWTGSRRFVSISYVNGYPCTTLAADSLIGDTEVTLSSTLGVYPGTDLTLDDGGGTEQVTVASSYVPGSGNPVQLTATLTYPHTAGAALSAMPEDIKRAVVLLTAAVIKTRGNRAFVMQQLAAPTTTTPTQAGGTEDLALARQLLTPHKRSR